MHQQSVNYSNLSTVNAVSHGAHITSWVVDGKEQLFLSPECLFENGKAIRGGIPIIFPQFETHGKGPRHGFARISEWQIMGDTKALEYQLIIEKDQYPHWPYRAVVNFSAQPDKDNLRLTLTVKNMDHRAFNFTCALHTYLKVDCLSNIMIDGLTGLNYWTHSEPFSMRRIETQDTLKIQDKIDRIYFNAKSPITLRDKNRSLTFTSTGFEDVVIWNPGKDDAQSIPDLADDSYQNMICIEPASVNNPVVLNPQQDWTAEHVIRLSH